MRIDKDRFSDWVAVGVVAWTVYCLLLGLPIFHLGLGVWTIRVVAFFTAAGLLQLAVTPWAFWARATPQNPDRRFGHQIAAGCVWVCSTVILLLCFVQYGKAIDQAHFGERLLIILGIVVAFGLVALGVGIALSRRVAERPRT